MEKESGRDPKTGRTPLWIVPTIIICAVILLLLVGTVLFLRMRENSRYKEQLSLGDKYLAEMDYESAVLAYQAAINIQPKSDAGYLQLAQVYRETGDYAGAIAVMEEARDRMGLETANKEIAELETLQSKQDVLASVQDVAEADEEEQETEEETEYAFLSSGYVQEYNGTVYTTTGDENLEGCVYVPCGSSEVGYLIVYRDYIYVLDLLPTGDSSFQWRIMRMNLQQENKVVMEAEDLHMYHDFCIYADYLYYYCTDEQNRGTYRVNVKTLEEEKISDTVIDFYYMDKNTWLYKIPDKEKYYQSEPDFQSEKELAISYESPVIVDQDNIYYTEGNVLHEMTMEGEDTAVAELPVDELEGCVFYVYKRKVFYIDSTDPVVPLVIGQIDMDTKEESPIKYHMDAARQSYGISLVTEEAVYFWAGHSVYKLSLDDGTIQRMGTCFYTE